MCREKRVVTRKQPPRTHKGRQSAAIIEAALRSDIPLPPPAISAPTRWLGVPRRRPPALGVRLQHRADRAQRLNPWQERVTDPFDDAVELLDQEFDLVVGKVQVHSKPK